MARRLVALSAGLCLAGAALAAHAQPPPVSPQDFASAAAAADQYEITAARVALVESRDPALRGFAQTMVREHTAAIQAVRDAAVRSDLAPPADTMTQEQASLLSALQGLRGADFDRAYARQQVLAHVQALTTEVGYARTGGDANLRALAQSDVSMIQRHLQEARALKAAAGG